MSRRRSSWLRIRCIGSVLPGPTWGAPAFANGRSPGVATGADRLGSPPTPARLLSISTMRWRKRASTRCLPSRTWRCASKSIERRVEVRMLLRASRSWTASAFGSASSEFSRSSSLARRASCRSISMRTCSMSMSLLAPFQLKRAAPSPNGPRDSSGLPSGVVHRGGRQGNRAGQEGLSRRNARRVRLEDRRRRFPRRRSSDAGEPSGTAGRRSPRPSNRRASATSSSSAVVRYFGGTKLGTGGLSRAYRQAADAAIAAAGRRTLRETSLRHRALPVRTARSGAPAGAPPDVTLAAGEHLRSRSRPAARSAPLARLPDLLTALDGKAPLRGAPRRRIQPARAATPASRIACEQKAVRQEFSARRRSSASPRPSRSRAIRYSEEVVVPKRRGSSGRGATPTPRFQQAPRGWSSRLLTAPVATLPDGAKRRASSSRRPAARRDAGPPPRRSGDPRGRDAARREPTRGSPVPPTPPHGRTSSNRAPGPGRRRRRTPPPAETLRRPPSRTRRRCRSESSRAAREPARPPRAPSGGRRRAGSGGRQPPGRARNASSTAARHSSGGSPMRAKISGET